MGSPRDDTCHFSEDHRGAFLDILEVDPLNAHAYDNLGSTLRPGESLRLPDGLLVSKQALHSKALELDPSHGNAHNNLAASMGSDEVLCIQGQQVTRRWLFQRAVELDASNAVAHCNLGVVLGNSEVVCLADGSSWDKRSLYVEAIGLDPSYAFAYNNLANLLDPHERIRLPDASQWDRKSLYTAAIELDNSYAVAFNNLGLVLGPEEQVCLADGSTWDRRSLHGRALELNPGHTCAYRDLASALHANERIRLAISNGPAACDDWGRCELLERALELDQGDASTHLQLAVELELAWGWKTVKIGSFQCEFDCRALLRRAISLDPLETSCMMLRSIVTSRQETEDAMPGLLSSVADGLLCDLVQCPAAHASARRLDRPSEVPLRLDRIYLAIAAIEQGTRSSTSCNSLGEFLAPGERVWLSTEPGHGAWWTRRELHLEALLLDPQNARSWLGLGVALAPGERLCLALAGVTPGSDSKVWDRRAVFARAAELELCHTIALGTVHNCMKAQKKARGSYAGWHRRLRTRGKCANRSADIMRTGGDLTQASLRLHAKACKLRPSSVRQQLRMVAALGWEEGSGDAISFAHQAFQLDPFNADACHQLGMSLIEPGVVELPNGTQWCKEALLVRAVQLEPLCSTFYDELRSYLQQSQWQLCNEQG